MLGKQSMLIGQYSLCTVSPGGRGVCTGDNGSPLFDKEGILVGIVSRDNACGRGVPDIYTRINPYVTYINRVVRSR